LTDEQYEQFVGPLRGIAPRLGVKFSLWPALRSSSLAACWCWARVVQVNCAGFHRSSCQIESGSGSP
jgi:hypothetical protein